MSNQVRFATFNASLNRNESGQLIQDLSTPQNEQAQTIAEIIQRVNPDVLLVNEFDFDAEGIAADLFRDNYLEISQNGVDPVEYPFVYLAPSNTGIASGFDLDNNGEIVTTPGANGYGNDALGFGNFPGQFAMVLYSKYPIVEEEVRTFQNFLWQDMPGALLPDNLETPQPNDWYSAEELEVFPLSSKSHWDVPIEVNGEIIHVLASHPTPPVFDGEEDRNGRRNHDEIRFWADYITPGEGDYIYDDEGNFGGLNPGNYFVIMGDKNADPFDGDSFNNAIDQLLENPLVNTSVIPDSVGGVAATNRQGGESANHLGDPAFDTADFNDATGTSGNLRVDYVLPSENQEIVDAAVFWPTENDTLFPLVGDFPFPSSDHRLVWADVTGENRKTVTNIEFIGDVEFESGFDFAGTEVGGISGITYDKVEGSYYAISDDRSERNNARFYTVDIDLSDGTLDDGDVEFTDFTTLLNEDRVPFPENGIDPEAIAFDGENLFISSEAITFNDIDPFINLFSLTGEQLNELTIPDKFLANEDGTQGIRDNLGLESLTITPNQRFLYTATENTLLQDGSTSTLENEGTSRIIKYDLETGEVVKEFLYFVDPIIDAPVPADDFAVNGLVELLALDNTDTLLALERSFSSGVGNNIRLYEVQLQNTTNIQDFDGLINPNDPDGELFDVDAVAEKRLLLDFADLGITLDNDEGMTFGPVLPDGSQSLVVVNDNNFGADQVTQFLGFSLDIDTIPAVHPTDETPNLIRTATGADADDPAIYVHPNNPNQSLVISTLKDAGLAVYGLNGQLLQEISPETPGDIRYNNVDIVYDFQIRDETVDLAVATDRENDTLAIWSIDPQTRQLTNITAANLSNPPASIFGIDDGEKTAYGLATYTNPNTGETYAYVSQRDGNQIAQLELTTNQNGTVSASEVRRLTVPIPDGGELDDAQVEGMVVDRELGILYAGQENFGIWKFDAEANASTERTLVDEVGENIQADVEGLTIYYADNGNGYLLASSQGDNTFAVYDRQGDNEFIGNFFIGDFANIDGAEESDGADVINVPLGNNYPNGLLVVQDGANEPEVVLQDPEDGEIQNFNTNFKFIPWENVANAFEEPLKIDRFSFNPREISDSLINGIASGDTTQTSTVLWANSNTPGEITFEVATNSDFTNIIQIVNSNLTDAPAKVNIEELNPDTEYYYRVTDAAGSIEIGEFETAAELGSINGLKFGVAGDWRGELAPYPAIANADEADLDFFVLHGDTIFADGASPAVPKPQAETIEEFRAKHEEVYSDRFGENAWADLRATTSIFATIDDSEVTDEFSGGAPANTDPRFPETTGLINDTQLYENGLQAFQEFNPLRDEFYGDTGENRTAGERQLYRFNTHGNDAATFVLDTRSFRDQALPAVGEVTEEAFIEASFDSNRTILGEVQLEDLKNDLLQAENDGITWKFVMVPEPIQNLGTAAASDRFEGYAAERTEILKFIDDNNIDNVVFVAADLHGTVVNNITYQEEFGGEQIPLNAFEITTGPVSFDPPFGPSLIETAAALDALSPEQLAFYDNLPVRSDRDSQLNDKDDFIKQLINDAISPLGYDPIGLNNNLEIAEGAIDATLIQGDYISTHTYGWTEFEIDAETQQLRVVTYGIEPYTEDELLENPQAIINSQLEVVSEFVVNPILPTVGINLEPEIVTENEEEYTLTFNLSKPAPTGGLRVVWSETDTDNAFGDIELPELENASNLEELDPVGDELPRSAITIDAGATTATVTWTTIPDDEVEDDETTTIELIAEKGYVVDEENQVAEVTIVDTTPQEIIGTPNDDRLRGNFGNDRIVALAGDDTLNGRDGNDVIIGSRGNDSLYGKNGDDTLEGRQGFDHLFGGEGNDEMNGGQGRDRLNGGLGDDTLSGGASIDRFIFATNEEFDSNDLGIDEITDFVVEQDKILLDRTTFTAINDIEVDFATVTGAAATSDAVIVYNTSNGQLFYNPNGSADGFGDGGQFATLSNQALLEVDDFIIRG
ncbi:phytase [Hydrocoleum sp. CS-953]|uniref:phytase n=1 Tax=Hydrocoleum sp. CS-953 TaxID=1671698 RepID=UPI000B9A4CA3|nr:phytase [Hydrocoleum sp. CS-953]